MAMGWLRTAVSVAVVAAFFALCGDPTLSDPSSTSAPKLHDTSYTWEHVEAPAASGVALRALSFLLTGTPLGPTVRRYLLDKNKVSQLRELANQVPAVPPLVYPLRRLAPEERGRYDATAAAASAQGLGADGVIKAGLPDSDGDTSVNNIDGRIAAYNKLYNAGQLDPVVATRRAIRAARAAQDRYHAFVSIDEEGAMAAAEASRARRQSGGSGALSVLDGVPFAIKDMIDVKGLVTTDGSRSNDDAEAGHRVVARDDDELVARLKALGAIALGTTVMTEGGVTPLGYSVHHKGPYNPHASGATGPVDGAANARNESELFYSGGSSSGSAVAVALGIVPFAIGFDGGGSIRIPASWSGVTGLATTWGRIGFTQQRWGSMVKSGPIAASAADAAVAYAAMSLPTPAVSNAEFAPAPSARRFERLYDGGSHDALPVPHLAGWPGAHRDLSGVRLGIFDAHFDDVTDGVRGPCRRAVDALVARGAVLVPIAIPHIGALRLAHAVKISTEFASGWDGTYSSAQTRNMLEPNTRITVGLGYSMTAVEALAADRLRGWAFDYVTDLFANHSLAAIVSPTLPMSATAIPQAQGALEAGESNTGLVVEMMKFIFMANFIGQPGISVPVGADALNGNMPVGLHFLGDHWHEHDLLRLARATELEAAAAAAAGASWGVPRPALWTDVLKGVDETQ